MVMGMAEVMGDRRIALLPNLCRDLTIRLKIYEINIYSY